MRKRTSGKAEGDDLPRVTTRHQVQSQARPRGDRGPQLYQLHVLVQVTTPRDLSLFHLQGSLVGLRRPQRLGTSGAEPESDFRADILLCNHGFSMKILTYPCFSRLSYFISGPELMTTVFGGTLKHPSPLCKQFYKPVTSAAHTGNCTFNALLSL